MSSHRRNELIRALPYARRYARALTGTQTDGDALVADALKGMLAEEEGNPEQKDARLALYTAVTRRTPGVVRGVPVPQIGLAAEQRQLLLLTALEELSLQDAAPIVGIPLDQADSLLAEARDQLRAHAETSVLIIEDEPIIAMDLEELVTECGHRVVGVAASEAEAVAIAGREQPGLILADINLGSGGDGASAVARIQQHLAAPVIFVTAYPERLLTGDAIEPAFVITKPFEPLTLAIATYQAVTGGLRID